MFDEDLAGKVGDDDAVSVDDGEDLLAVAAPVDHVGHFFKRMAPLARIRVTRVPSGRSTGAWDGCGSARLGTTYYAVSPPPTPYTWANGDQLCNTWLAFPGRPCETVHS